jgi:pyruvate dehydrogenase E1 component beta subunit
MSTMTQREAIRDGMRRALAADERVFLMGEDVGRYGGAFAVSGSLLEEFGPERVRDAPLAESAFVGAGIGAAINGMRPIVEIMTINFSMLALDQIVNNAATLRYMSGGQIGVPLVVRMATGGGRQMAAQHAHSLESWYAHVPGIKALSPATVADGRAMVLAAVEDPDPVFIFENAILYGIQGDAGEDGLPDVWKAEVRRQGLRLALEGARRRRAACRRGDRSGGDRPPLLAAARHRHGARLGREDPPCADRRRGMADRQHCRRGERADHGARVRSSGAARLQR